MYQQNPLPEIFNGHVFYYCADTIVFVVVATYQYLLTIQLCKNFFRLGSARYFVEEVSKNEGSVIWSDPFIEAFYHHTIHMVH